MKKIEFSEELSSGETVIDAQHKQLIKILNNLISDPQISIHSEFFSEILNDLMIYSQQHFDYEETLLEKYDYPHIEEHKKEHNEFLENLAEIIESVVEDDYTAPKVLTHYLYAWVSKHLIESDQKYFYLTRKTTLE